MNLLAHALLSPPHNDGLLIGNLTADWIKGRARVAVPPEIRAGFALHRRIDSYTDAHPLVGACADFLAPEWNRYAPILVDVLFDHVLARDFQRFSDEPLASFSGRIYQILLSACGQLPHGANYAIAMMSADDWFGAYASLDGLRLTFSRMSTRLRSRGHCIELGSAVDTFLHHRAEIESAFDSFFPTLESCVSTFLAQEQCHA